jgi:hypothetical protein
MSESTRIADLPENNTSKPSFSQMAMPNGGMQSSPIYSQGLDIPTNGNGMPNTNYVQMNVHPNPYGNGPPQNTGIGLPQQTHTTRPSNNPYISQSEQPPHMAHLPQHQLPSRDIPHDTTSYYQDPEITPNYIPQAKVSSDFVKEYEETYKQKEMNIKTRDKSIRSIDDLFVEFRITIIVSLLFLLFQSPVFHTMLLKHFSIFTIYNSDGNLNIHGLLVKSAMFGFAYYTLEKLGEYVR